MIRKHKNTKSISHPNPY